jgi:anti-sigma B factor antagonist
VAIGPPFATDPIRDSRPCAIPKSLLDSHASLVDAAGFGWHAFHWDYPWQSLTVISDVVEGPRRSESPFSRRAHAGMNIQHIEVARSDDITVAKIVDRKIVDDADIQELGQELFELVEGEQVRKLVLNFSQVGFLSSAALGRLLILHKKARQNNSCIILTGLQPTILEVFVLTRLNELFVIKDTDAEAIQSLSE